MMDHPVENNSSLLERLRCRQPLLSHLHFGYDTVWELTQVWDEFCQVLQGSNNTNILQEVTVDNQGLGLLGNARVQTLVQQLGYLQNLKRLHVILQKTVFTHTVGSVEATSLARLLERCPTLEQVVLQCSFSIAEAELPVLNQAVRRHPSLDTLCLSHVVTVESYPINHNVTRNGIHHPLCLSSFVASLVSVPNLRHLELVSGCSWQQARDEGARDEGATARILSDPSVAASLVQLLQQNTLESLALRNVGLTDEHAQQVALALTQNTSLQRLDWRSQKPLGPSGHLALMQAMVVDNCCLERLDLDWFLHHDQLKDVLARLQFHLRLNRAGRYKFVKQATASFQERLELLIASQNHLDVTFVLLQQNPSMIGIEMAERLRRSDD